MKKVLFVLLLALAPAAFGQVNFVRTTPAKSVFLTSVADIDTIFLLFPKNLSSPAFFDTSKANLSRPLPAQDFISAQGKFTVWLQRTNINGVADSFKLYIKKISPDGYLNRADSVFVLGSASTFADVVSNTGYEFVINGPCLGLGLMFRKGDGGSILKTKVTARVDYTQ